MSSAAEWMGLQQDMVNLREQNRRADLRFQALRNALDDCEKLGGSLERCVAPNHHLRTNHHILRLCLRDEIETAQAECQAILLRISNHEETMREEGMPEDLIAA